jgi:hypothetical protein
MIKNCYAKRGIKMTDICATLPEELINALINELRKYSINITEEDRCLDLLAQYFPNLNERECCFIYKKILILHHDRDSEYEK